MAFRKNGKKNEKKFVQKRRNEVFSVVDIMGGEMQWTCLNEMKCFRTNALFLFACSKSTGALCNFGRKEKARRTFFNNVET